MATTYFPLGARLSRRDWLQCSFGGVATVSFSGWLSTVARAYAPDPARKRSCILLWMSGGPAQTDTFDLKPGHANGGPYRPIATYVPGIQISEHLPQVARRMSRLAVIRSMSTREGDHGRATYHLRTGNLPMGAIDFPLLGSLAAKELGKANADLPSFVSIAPNAGFSAPAFAGGFLGPRFAPLIVGERRPAMTEESGALENSLRVPDLDLPAGVNQERGQRRNQLLADLQGEFVSSRPGLATESHRSAYQQALRLMKESAAGAFKLQDEAPALRDRYGRSFFGQACLLARRLVERGVPFVEVTLGASAQSPAGWDTHQNNFDLVKTLSQVLDPAWATLLDDLKDRGLLDSTVVAWMGEFGRTPRINPQNGRDHYPNAWSVVLGGGGIKGGQVVGRTSDDGMTVADRPVKVPDLLATVCMALGVDPEKQNMSNVGRPIRIVDKSAQPIHEVLA